MKSYLADPFFRHWHPLPVEIKRLARKNYQLWKANPRHGSLRFKPVKPGVWSARIGLDYRVLGRMRRDSIYWFWIGDHREYERILRQMQG